MPRTVEAVFFWRYSKAAFAAAYGRFAGSSKYTKDFLQSPANQYPVIDDVLGRNGAASVPVRYSWPGGEGHGEWRMSAADARGQLSWLPLGASPLPWRVGDPKTNSAVTIPGNPGLKNEAAADAEYGRLEAANLDPWILAVKLRDETGVLYPRAYLGNPPAGLEARSIATLPRELRKAIGDLPKSVGGGAVTFTGTSAPTMRSPALYERIKDALSRDPNVLIIGPPGTGKTVVLEDLRAHFSAQAGTVFFNTDKWDGTWSEVDSSEHKAISVVFHPSYGYEDFVAGLLPSMDSTGFRLTARPGPLLSLAHWASGSKERRGLLIIDEFNRGPAAAIFGDTLALLDADKRSDAAGGRSGAVIVRPYPREEMKVEPTYANMKGEVNISTDLSLPASVWIVAAMNSSDRSVAPLDAALRRRFAIITVPPDYQVLAQHLGIACPAENDTFVASTPDPAAWSVTDAKLLVVHLLRSLNGRLGSVLGADFLLGHALLWPVRGESVEQMADTLAQAFDERISASLRLAFADQDEALAAVLRAGFPGESGVNSAVGATVGVARWLLPSSDMQTVASPRLEILNQSGRPYVEILRALQALL